MSAELSKLQDIPLKKSHISIGMRLENFRKAAEELAIPLTPEEMTQMKNDIKDHAEYIWERLSINAENAVRLKAKAKEITEAAKSIENSVASDKKYLLEAMQSSGIPRITFGEFKMEVAVRKSMISKRPATEKDFTANNEIVIPKFSWKRDPEVTDLLDHEELVEKSFEWDLNKFRGDKKKYANYIDYKVSKTVSVKINKDGK